MRSMTAPMKPLVLTRLAPTDRRRPVRAWLFSAVCAGLSVTAAGCGGGLKYKVDDAALDSVPTGERQPVFAAQNEIEIAKSEQRSADSQLQALGRDQDVAKAEKKQAELEVEKAGTEEESAVASHDENRHAAALHGKQVAAVGVKAADAKLDWLDEKQTWLKTLREAADAHQHAAEAKFELEKARVAKQRGIKPDADFAVDDYESQWKSKDSDWQSAKKDAESLQKKTSEREQSWKDLSGQQAKLKG